MIAKSFKAYYPFISGFRLDEYLRSNNINLSTCANFISDLEEKIMQAEDFVFPDIATPSNTIIILPRKSNQCKSDQLLFWVIDPDDIQFGQYGCQRTPTRLGVVLSGKIPPRGVKKCFNDVIFDGYSKEVANKQLDLRSMYSIFYDMMNGEQHFYPQKYERTMEEYHELLRSFNVPIGSPLYENSLATLSDDIPNNPKL